MKKVKQIILLMLLITSIYSCNNDDKESTYESTAIIRDFNSLQYPCHGFYIEIEGEETSKEVLILPNGVFEKLSKFPLPICVNINWHETTCDNNSQNLIAIDSLEILNSTIETTSLEAENNCINTLYQSDIDLSENYTIIRSQSAYDNLVTGSCQPQIDFSQYDLVIGKKGLPNGIISVDYQLFENCENQDLELQVQFNLNLTTVAPNVTYHRLIPKLGVEQNLIVEITMNQNQI